MKNGFDHLASLRDGRDVFIYGARVDDVTTHPAFRRSVASAAALYDFQCAPANVESQTFESPDTGERVNRCWQLPTSLAELVARRQALTAWAETHFGFMGRSPDHVASCISGMYMGADQFDAHDPARGAALREYYRYARDHDLFLTYVIINPHANRAAAAHESGEDMIARLVDQDAAGITVKGAKMLGTSAIMANEVFVTCIQPLRPGEEDRRRQRHRGASAGARNPRAARRRNGNGRSDGARDGDEGQPVRALFRPRPPTPSTEPPS